MGPARVKPTVHTFKSTAEAYDASQSDDEIRDGDVLVGRSEAVVGVLVGAWPTAVTARHGSFHYLRPSVTWDSVEGGRYNDSVAVATAEIEKLGRTD